MSRLTIYKDDRITVITGVDHAIGKFFQIFDKEMENETPEGEGVVYEWSELFGVETNYTGFPSTLEPQTIMDKYINEHCKLFN
jgi:hypothetical protein